MAGGCQDGRVARRRAAGTAARQAWRGRLPDRYEPAWWYPHRAELLAHLGPGTRILDVGAGAKPSLPAEQRPEGCEYVGLDVSLAELDRAPEGSYDRTIGADVARRQPDLEGRFDLVLCWEVLEHVRPLEVVLENLRSYLRPGGRLAAHLAGAFALHAVVNRVVPRRVGVRLVERFTGRQARDVFPAHYDRCWASALDRIMRPWSEARVLPLWSNAVYVSAWRPLRAVVIGVEEWVRLGGHANLASHYYITATR